MTSWSVEHRAFAVEEYFRNDNSIIKVQRLFRRKFNVNRHGSIPSRNTILRWVDAFRTTGSATKRHSPGRPISVRTPEASELVRESVSASPTRSARRHSAALEISRRSLHRILKDINFHPYKMVIVQTLTDSDFAQRKNFCEEMLNIINNINPLIMMSDEAHFHLDGYVNKQNFRYWAASNPQQLHERPLHSRKVTVWCGVYVDGIIGPYFFEEDGSTVTVNSARYIEMLNTFLRPQLQEMGLDMESLWFQQDGATAHTARSSLKQVREMFPGHVISRFGDVHWPARSPDLSICDFFLWGYLKSRVYRDNPRTIEQLKSSIRHEIRNVSNEMLRNSVNSFQRRLRLCIQEDGRHLTDVLFHS